MEVNGLHYLSTVQDLKVKLFGICKLRPSQTKILKDGRRLGNEQRTLLSYGVSEGTVLEAKQLQSPDKSSSDMVRIFVRTTQGYRLL